jgi:hypothetical protein
MRNKHSSVFEIVLGKDHLGNHVVSVIVKHSYRITPDGTITRRETDHPLRKIDHYYDDGDPEWATVQYESELAPYKPETDMVVIGKAYAPQGAATQEMNVRVKVGLKEKTLIIIGDRECHFRANRAPVFSDPLPFSEMEIRYERAYGGKDETSVQEIPFYYARNTMGKGVVLRNTRESVEGLPLPNIEDPKDRLTPERLIIEEPERWHLQPLPQGFGWRQRTWYPRCALLGVYPAFTDVGTVTAEERMGLLPKNHVALAKQSKLPTYEAEFNNGASLDMTFPALQGNEQVSLSGLSPNSQLVFSLPSEKPNISLDIGKGAKQLDTQLHTLSVRPDDFEVDLIWRGAYLYEGYSWWSHSKRLHAEVA